ncbi:MAG: sigma-54 dependent transcriptional regulator [Candidatus Binataceae bacterium]
MEAVNVQERNSEYKARVLIVDDELSLARMAAGLLRKAGYECETCPTVEAAMIALELHGADVILTDLTMPGVDGMELLRNVQAKRPDVAVVVSASTPSTDSTAEALRAGAFDSVAKPFNGDELNSVIARAVEMSSLQRENKRLRDQLEVAATTAEFIAESRQSRALVATIRRVAPSHATSLIQGETGTGKELVARMLHFWSGRAEGPFVAVNCKAFADGVVESELFGHEKGSFTGAIRDRAGCFERASGGTLFLDEIGEAGPDFQAKLLRVLEDGEVMRVGASKPRKVDVRIVAATNRVLRREVESGGFRADLYFRLNVIPLIIAPLRERREDILALANHFLIRHSADAGRPITLSPDAAATLAAYPWPGNVRELENVIERAVVMSGAEVLEPEAFALDEFPMGSSLEELGKELGKDLGKDIGSATPAAAPSMDAASGASTAQASAESLSHAETGTLQDCLDRAAGERIKTALAAVNGNRVEAAAALGVDRTTLYRLMKRLGL